MDAEPDGALDLEPAAFAHDDIARLTRLRTRIADELDTLHAPHAPPGTPFDRWEATLRRRRIEQLGARLTTLEAELRSSRLLADSPALAFARRIRAMPDVELTAWWATASHPKRCRAIQTAPSAIGGGYGLGTAVRDQANRLVLHGRIRALTSAITAAAPQCADEANLGILSGLRAERRAYRRVLAALSGQDDPPAALLALDSSHTPPLATVAIGEPSHARHVSILVPGMGRTTDGMTGWAHAGRNLFAAQCRLRPDLDHAVLAWIGYETPDQRTVRGNRHAEQGAGRLRTDLQRLCRARPTTPHISIVAHSYGTTTAALALADPCWPIRARTVVLLGSAGIAPGLTVHDLAAERVWAAEAPQPALPFHDGDGDGWASIGRNVSGRTDPREPAFGAEQLDLTPQPGEHPVLAHAAVPRAEGRMWHGYLDAGTAALERTASATVAGLEHASNS